MSDATNQTDKDRIEAGQWVDCYICSVVYMRKRETKRYCRTCKRGFCEGEHGTFQGGPGTCVRCYKSKGL
jgi:hypothetical protein